ncbi:Lysophospholipase, alpha-beta hydrolase superfamily [Micromonospora phaseoli]|uniref:Lysophospholipase, alpha-beta hydrolase superfamily n=1 Tax=Micromonospora phaseoli TaxID=1144548 RepID=A0A1H6V644_9ACTN|nr:alpha/beta hydrolase [Micromonospora phaseoli]PZV93692.1 alpha-beta hydrolase superfamily lysophospholipase [Micromonospora phaseoli]GIJ79172.1 esterase [Micromonospora phaseoli]SEJ00053.1 Lysophospholipase, alpha-beta hydrolase superfamily [Micromonospora phaseoli]
MEPRRRSYQGVTRWLDYQAFYPPGLRCDLDNAPTEEWWRWRGTDIHLDRLAAPEAPTKVVLLHGAGGYGRMLAPYARLLARESPVEVLAPDLIGYGLTSAGNRPVSYQEWIDCVTDLVAAEQARDGRPVFLFGASIGGMLAYSVAAGGNLAGLVVTCLLDPREVTVRMRMTRLPVMGRAGPSMLGRLRGLDALPIPMRWVANMAAMSNDPDLNALVRADPSGGGNRVTLRFLRTFLSWAPPVEPDRFTACPVLMTHPAADRWTPVELSRPFFDRIAAPKQLVLLEQAGHLPVEEPGLTQLGRAVGDFLR